MDPLSFTASIVTLLGTVNGVIKGLSKIRDLRNAPDEFLDLLNEVQEMRLILNTIKSLLLENQQEERLSLGHQPLAQLCRKAQAQLLEIDKIVEDRLLRPGTTDKVERMAWMKQRTKIQDIRNNLRNIRGSLATMLGTLSLSVGIRNE
jgi:hypothetical protein